MAEYNERGLFHHHDHKKPEADVVVETTTVESSATVVEGEPVDARVEIKKHTHKEHLAEAGALLGGAISMFEKHEAKKDPANAHKHHIGEAVAGAVAIGSGAYAVHEHHDKKDAKEEDKHHHHHGH